MTKYCPIIFAFNGNYAKYAAVSIFSVLIHSKSKCKIYCIITDTNDDQIAPIKSLSDKFNTEIIFINVTLDMFKEWNFYQHASREAYLRLFAPKLIPEEVALYLDSDLVVTCDITPLFEASLGEAYVAGCIDELGASTSQMPLKQGSPYLNGGVMLLNLEALRRNNFLERCIEIYAQYTDQVTYADQCIINKFAEDHKLVLTNNWNVQFNQHKQGTCAAIVSPFDQKGIIHFSGGTKPWMQWSDSYLSKLWLNYARFVDIPQEEFLIKAKYIGEWVMLGNVLETEGNLIEALKARNTLIDFFLKNETTK